MSTLISGTVAGLLAGIAATWIMDRFQYNWWDVAAFIERRRGRAPLAPEPPADPATATEIQEFSGPSTAKVANWFFRRWKGRDLNVQEKGPAGEIVHYVFGIANAVLFGVVLSVLGIVGIGWGVAFGIALFVAVDEIGLWAVGLAKGPWTYALSIHVYALAAHLVYGLELPTVLPSIRPDVVVLAPPRSDGARAAMHRLPSEARDLTVVEIRPRDDRAVIWRPGARPEHIALSASGIIAALRGVRERRDVTAGAS